MSLDASEWLVVRFQGTMEALYFGSAKGGLNHGGAGAGPWIMADMENALW